MYRVRTVAGAAAILAAVLASPLAAQQDGMVSGDDMMMSMGDSTVMAKHLVLTPHWNEQPGDRARADSLLVTARAALDKYQDVAEAERDGYHMFAPKVKRQRIYHYSNRKNAFKGRFSFDPSAPTALLYSPEPGGKLRLVGAMYTAPASIPLEELDQRIPLSIAQWHQHTSICLPPGMSKSDMKEMGMGSRDPRFGPRGSIATEDECKAAGGEFEKRMFNWMVHVNMFEGGEQVWEHKH
jgi:hypothetical protein